MQICNQEKDSQSTPTAFWHQHHAGARKKQPKLVYQQDCGKADCDQTEAQRGPTGVNTEQSAYPPNTRH
jgi:hypothetical protein